MNASSGSGLWPRRISTGRLRADLRPKNQRSSGPRSSLRVKGRTCSGRPSPSETRSVVVEHAVRLLERVLELVALEDVVVVPRLSRRVLRVHARPTAHIAALLRSIQTTMRSSAPASSNPWSSRSAKRDAVDARSGMSARIQSPPMGGSADFIRNLFSFLFATLEPGGPARGVRDPRARARAARSPRSSTTRTSRTVSRRTRAAGCSTTRIDPRDRRGRRRSARDARAARPRARLRARARARSAAAPAATSHAAMPFDLKTTMSSADSRPGELAGDDLLQLVHLEPVEDAALDRLDQVARLEPRLLDRVAADERGALEHDVVELARAPGRSRRPRRRARPGRATRRGAPGPSRS